MSGRAYQSGDLDERSRDRWAIDALSPRFSRKAPRVLTAYWLLKAFLSHDAWSRLRAGSRYEFAFANRGTCSEIARAVLDEAANEPPALTAAPH